jgi:hypothetical protein
MLAEGSIVLPLWCWLPLVLGLVAYGATPWWRPWLRAYLNTRNDTNTTTTPKHMRSYGVGHIEVVDEVTPPRGPQFVDQDAGELPSA